MINEFNFTDNQAEAIVNLRLYRLSKTNINDLLNESLELQKMIGELKLLISSEQLQKIALKQKIMSYIDEYPLKRRSSLLEKTNLVDAELTIVLGKTFKDCGEGFARIS
mgnify:CR=1 FL=1